jgi:hypothetical protein
MPEIIADFRKKSSRIFFAPYLECATLLDSAAQISICAHVVAWRRGRRRAERRQEIRWILPGRTNQFLSDDAAALRAPQISPANDGAVQFWEAIGFRPVLGRA